MGEMSVEECGRLAAAYLGKGDTAQGQAYATLGLLMAFSAQRHDHPEFALVLRVAVAAERFFTQPSDTVFAEVSAALDEWQAFRGVVEHV